MVDIVELRFEVDDRQLQQANTRTKNLTGALGLTSGALKGLGIGFAAIKTKDFLVDASKNALLLDKRLTALGTLLSDTSALDGYRGAAQRLAVQFGTDTTTQVDGFYQAI